MEMRNPPGGKIAQKIDGFSGKVTWQIVQADAGACQKFVSLFDKQPEILKYSVDCWTDADNESAALPVKIAMKQKDSGKDVTLETASPAACADAVQVVGSLGAYTLIGQCPAVPEKK
ncbi:MAG: hypothetical protein P4L87_17960 [Formivibrio sp.]|nr:hypothetical protein [Formivibrio sp.]